MTLTKLCDSERIRADCALCQAPLGLDAVGLYTPNASKNESLLVVCGRCIDSQTAKFFLPRAKAKGIQKILEDLQAQFGLSDLEEL
jgi:hypothetical protein